MNWLTHPPGNSIHETDFLSKVTYIIIPVYNRKNITLKCLENLRDNEDLDSFKIVVIDDGSTDGTRKLISKYYPDVIVLKGTGDLWWTGAISLGMKYAYTKGADYIVWLNDDCELLPETLSSLVQLCQEQSNVIAGAQGFLKGYDNRISFGGKRKTWKGYRLFRADKHVYTCDLLSGNIVCIPRKVIDAIGFPGTRNTPHYGGDSLYLIRAQKAGIKLLLDARFPALNLPGESDLYPSKNWLTCAGRPHRLLELVFNPYSGLSWKVWLTLNWEAYGFWGIIMFAKKYFSIILISIIRLIPFSVRKRLEDIFVDI